MRGATAALVVLLGSGCPRTDAAAERAPAVAARPVPASGTEPPEAVPRSATPCFERAFFVEVEDVSKVHHGDFDHDGTPELVVQHASPGVLEWVRGFGESSLRVTRHANRDLERSQLVGAVPVAGGHALLYARPPGDAVLAYGWREDQLVPLRRATARLGRHGIVGGPHCPAASWVDVDGDGVPEPVALGDGTTRRCTVHDASRAWVVWIGRGGPSASMNAAVRTDIVVPDTIVADLEFGDLDGDGLFDAAVLGAELHRHYATEDARLSVYFARPDGSYEAAKAVDVPSAAKDLHLVDVDGDGALDLVLTAGEGDRLTVIRPAADRSFSAPRGHAPGPRSSSGAFFTRHALLDLDGDGHMELLESRVDGSLTLFAFDGRTYVEVERFGGGESGTRYLVLEDAATTFGGRSGVLVGEGEGVASTTRLALWGACPRGRI